MGWGRRAAMRRGEEKCATSVCNRMQTVSQSVRRCVRRHYDECLRKYDRAVVCIKYTPMSNSGKYGSKSVRYKFSDKRATCAHNNVYESNNREKLNRFYSCRGRARVPGRTARTPVRDYTTCLRRNRGRRVQCVS